MPPRILISALIALGASGCARHAEAPASAHASSPAAQPDCLQDGSGFLRLRVRGAQSFDIDWHDAQLQCEGGPRPDGKGLRLTFATAAPAAEHRPRLVFGMATALHAGSSREVPTNVTLILEGENRLYSTRGDDRCTIDELVQTPIGNGAASGDSHAYRIAGRGFCAAPAAALDGRDDILISRFDFAGRVVDADVADHPQ